MILGQEVQVKVEKSNFHKCPVKCCSIAFLDANCLTTHIKHHERMFYAHLVSSYVEMKRVKIFECDRCRQCFLSKYKFLLHRLKHVNKSAQYAKESENIGGNGKVKLYKCSECEYEFVAKSTLDAHSVCHQAFSYICYCGVGYYQLQDLKSHKKLMHAVQKTEDVKRINNGMIRSSKTNVTGSSKKRRHGPKLKAELTFRRTLKSHPPLDVDFEQNNDGRYQCPDCIKTLASKASAELHYRSLHRGERPYICHICGKAFTQSPALQNHLLIHSGARNFACQYCNKPFLTYHTRALHERIHTGFKPYQCSFCEKAFSDPSAYKRHERIHTGDKKYICEYCPKAFTDNSQLYVHRKRHLLDRNHACKECSKKFYTKAELRHHFQVVHEHIYKFKCDYCHKEFSSKENVKHHILNRHSNSNKNKKTYNCEVCFKIFRLEQYLKIHMKVAHDRKRDYTCKVCYKQYVHKYDFNNHILMHSDVKKFECAHCLQKFHTKKYLRRHIVLKHITTLNCELCNRNFTCMTDLEQHKLEIGDRCNICGEEFFCKGEALVHHNKVHALTKTESRYECDYCGKVFSKCRLIRRHIIQFHLEPKFICEHCGKRFALKDAIRSHMTMHLDVLRCNICYKIFYSTFDLQNHKRTSCTLVKHLCEICDKSFSTSSSLRSHLLVHMDDRKTYKCPLCPKEFFHKTSVIKHVSRVHNNKKRLKKKKSKISPSRGTYKNVFL